MTFRKRGIGMRSYRQLTAESLETRQLLAAVDFTAHDQLMLELVNRARMAPLEERVTLKQQRHVPQLAARCFR